MIGAGRATTPPATSTRPGLFALWLRFLRIGALAWGGPVAQIGNLHRELVEQERWVDEARFRKALAVYQILPGPEATEMCIWFGTVARGRLGGLVAGLGFLLPGLTLMLIASWALLGRAAMPPAMTAAFAGMQCAVVALVVRAAARLWNSAVGRDPGLWLIAAISLAGQFAGVPFAASLVAGGVAVALRGRGPWHALVLAVWIGATVWCALHTQVDLLGRPGDVAGPLPDDLELARTGLRAGLLTFGGAYTAIPFLQDDAVGEHGWMTLRSFQDGLAIGGVLPSPLIVFGTWVGFAGGGFAGAAIVTAAIFLPAFLFPLLLHDWLERAVAHPGLHHVLEGVTVAVVGLIGAIALQWISHLDSPLRVAVAVVALVVLMRLGHRLTALAVMAAAAAMGPLLT